MRANFKSTRRSFMSSVGALGAAILSPRKLFAAGCGAARAPDAKLSGFGASGNVYEELGVTTVINGQGTMTILGGSLARPEVEAVMALAGQHFCSIPELEVAAGSASRKC
jgi:L-seryl-tRNA(Ser) seleniumtransferase